MLLTITEGKGHASWWQRQAFADVIARNARKEEDSRCFSGDPSVVVRELWEINAVYIGQRWKESLRWQYCAPPIPALRTSLAISSLESRCVQSTLMSPNREMTTDGEFCISQAGTQIMQMFPTPRTHHQPAFGLRRPSNTQGWCVDLQKVQACPSGS